MPASISVGQQFGSLTVIAPDTRPHHTSSWLCRCECGMEKYIQTRRLLHGEVRSCGCRNRKKIYQDIDLTGKRFGHLTVLSRSQSPLKTSSWSCLCDCGNICDYPTSDLISFLRKSCGCSQYKKTASKEDLTGRRFGHLTVIKKVSPQKRYSPWRCLCDCGNELSLRTSLLLDGKRTSCGKCKYHRVKSMEKIIGQRFHHLTVINYIETSPNIFKLLCKCDCGEYTLATTFQLSQGRKRSCGCVLKKTSAKKRKWHGPNKAQQLGTNGSIRYRKSAQSNTGFKGIKRVQYATCISYVAFIKCQGIYHHLGSFATLDEANRARQAAEEKYFQPLIEQMDKLPPPQDSKP